MSKPNTTSILPIHCFVLWMRHTWQAAGSLSPGLAMAARMAVVVVPILEPSVRG